MKNCTANILGSEWKVKFGTPEEYPNLEDMDGYTDSSTREIIVDEGASDSWATNEEMVDWFAIQAPKIFKVFEENGLMRGENYGHFNIRLMCSNCYDLLHRGYGMQGIEENL